MIDILTDLISEYIKNDNHAFEVDFRIEESKSAISRAEQLIEKLERKNDIVHINEVKAIKDELQGIINNETNRKESITQSLENIEIKVNNAISKLTEEERISFIEHLKAMIEGAQMAESGHRGRVAQALKTHAPIDKELIMDMRKSQNTIEVLNLFLNSVEPLEIVPNSK